MEAPYASTSGRYPPSAAEFSHHGGSYTPSSSVQSSLTSPPHASVHSSLPRSQQWRPFQQPPPPPRHQGLAAPSRNVMYAHVADLPTMSHSVSTAHSWELGRSAPHSPGMDVGRVHSGGGSAGAGSGPRPPPPPPAPYHGASVHAPAPVPGSLSPRGYSRSLQDYPTYHPSARPGAGGGAGSSWY